MPGPANSINESTTGVVTFSGTAFSAVSAATTGQILRADGTNWVGTTATYPDASGADGNVLTSSGGNWVSSAPSSSVLVAEGTLTNAQIKALNVTPVQLIAAPGAGKVIRILSASSKIVYGGNNAFTNPSPAPISLSYGASSSGVTLMLATTIVATTTRTDVFPVAPTASTGLSTTFDNVEINARNAGIAFGGNAANDNTINYSILYYIMNI